MEVELDKKKLQFTNDKGEKVRVDIDQDQTEKDEEVFESNHYSNLAEELDEKEVGKVGKDLVRAYEDDKSSRKNWEDQYSKGLRMLGVIVEDRQDPFPGASGVHHPGSGPRQSTRHFPARLPGHSRRRPAAYHAARRSQQRRPGQSTSRHDDDHHQRRPRA